MITVCTVEHLGVSILIINIETNMFTLLERVHRYHTYIYIVYLLHAFRCARAFALQYRYICHGLVQLPD